MKAQSELAGDRERRAEMTRPRPLAEVTDRSILVSRLIIFIAVPLFLVQPVAVQAVKVFIELYDLINLTIGNETVISLLHRYLFVIVIILIFYSKNEVNACPPARRRTGCTP